MHAPVRNTTLAALIAAGFVAASPAAYADTVGDDHDALLNVKWTPLIDTKLNVCDTSLTLVQRSTVCATATTPAAPAAEQPAPAEADAAPDRCRAEAHCPLANLPQIVEVHAITPPQETEETPEPVEAPSREAEAEPVSAAEPGIAPVLEANIPRNNDTWHAASPEPEEIPPLRLAEIPRLPEPLDRPAAPEVASYALTTVGSQDSPLLTAGVATILLGGVAIYVGYGLGRADRPNLFR